MITLKDGVREAVWFRIKQRVPDNTGITNKTWGIFYDLERANAVAATIAWKQQFITIE